MKTFLLTSVMAITAAVSTSAQQPRLLSPPGTATTMVSGAWTKNAQGRDVYQGGRLIEVVYSRPMLRQRANIFGSGADYGRAVYAGAPLWRVGANQTTVFRTEVPLMFGGGTLPAGEYGLLADLKADAWTLIFTSQPRQKEFDASNKTDLIGAVNYDHKFDVLRVPMTLSTLDSRLDQLSIFFSDVTRTGGVLMIAWDTTVAAAPFTVAAGPEAVRPQGQRPPLSPPQVATAMVGGEWVKDAGGAPVYAGGKWIEIAYSAPMLRQRENIFGSGADYGKTVLAGAPVWRVGANQSTRIKTEVPLVFGGKTLPAGEYSMFVDLKEGAWTLIFSTWPAQQKFNPDDKTALWGAFGYTPDKDVLRVPMEVDASGTMPRIDQLTFFFCDVTKDSGKLAIAWDKTVAMTAFKVGSAGLLARRSLGEGG